MKRKFLLIFALCIVASCSIAFAVGCSHQHSYTQTVTGEKYLKSAATCTDKAEYYYSCSCGEKGEKTFEYGNANGHYYEDKKCIDCGELQPTAGLKYWLNPTLKEVAVGKGTATDTEIVIPSTYGEDNWPVTTIKDSGFIFCSNITSVIIPDSVTTIGQWAFSYCNSLISVTIPDSVIYIDYGAFDYCSGLKSVTVGSGATRLGYCIFQHCDNLNSVILRDGLTSISGSMFHKCSELTSITIPKSVKNIGSAAFLECDKLTVYYEGSEQDWNEIHIDNYNDELLNAPRYNNVVFDDNSGESGHVHLYTEKIIKSATCTEQGSVLYICSCGNTKSINVEALGHDYQDHSAKDATCIVDGWQAYQTCSRCDYTTYKAIPAVKEHNYVNGYCERCNEPKPTPNALTFTLKNDNTYEVKAMFKTIQEVNIPSVFNGKLVTSIGENAFNSCSLLTSINIPESIINIGNYAFDGCSDLASITIPNSVTTIGSYAFRNCSSLVSIIIPESITTISSYMFRFCTSLKNIFIPESVTTIGIYAFDGCSSLTKITIPNGITSINDYVFNDCSSLTSITIPDSITSIGYSSFGGCKSLLNITIPDNVTSIGNAAFWGCSSLTSIIIHDSVASMGWGVFEVCNSLTIYCELIAEPINWANNWNRGCPIVWGCKNNDIADDGNIYLIFNELRYALKEGNAMVARQPTNLNGEFKIEETITYKNIVYSVNSIAISAFEGCSNLISVTIPDSITSISAGAFSDCKSLLNITIPDGVTSIGDFTFHSCSSLISIIIPERIFDIGSFAFYYCEKLEFVYYKGNEYATLYWEKMKSLFGSKLYYYDKYGPHSIGDKCWHYGDDGVTPEIWE